MYRDRQRNPHLQGHYIYADLYEQLYVGREWPPLSGRFNAEPIDWDCSSESPMSCSCRFGSGILSFGELDDRTMVMLTQCGVYRVVNQSSCTSSSASSISVTEEQSPCNSSDWESPRLPAEPRQVDDDDDVGQADSSSGISTLLFGTFGVLFVLWIQVRLE